MDQSETAGFDRAKYLIGFVILAAVVLIGISAYFSANSAKGTADRLETALGAGKAGLAGVPAANSSAQQGAPATSPGSVVTGTGGEAQAPHVNSTAQGGAASQQNATQAVKKEVTIDFLYADWCPHCQSMKPIVAGLEALLPKDRFEVRYWNEASRSDAAVAEIYGAYADKGYFQGFPTFVANGNDYKVGSMPEATFKSWVCSKFSTPKPSGC